MLKAKVEIRLKRGVVDPEGKNITKALHLLNFSEVTKTKVSKVVEIWLETDDRERAMERVDEMCRRLLANPVINDYTIEIEDVHD
ncbi:MAG TPA: phosphoribosylformylglycinamidine synthase, purS protein [Thermoplasmatales archaeon]|nr:phosphoribosylformylglycinamidine synthase, purS protein [Thermoplasmatales archaeon]